MIFKKTKPLYLFMHIPKTGGTSLLNNADNAFGREKVLKLIPKTKSLMPDITFNNEFLVDNFTSEIKQNEKYDAVFGHFRYGLHLYFPNRDCKYITFLRNPVKQFVSSYYYLKNIIQYDFLKNLNQFDDIVASVSSIEGALSYEFAPTNIQAFFVSGVADKKIMQEDAVKVLDIASKNIKNDFLYVGNTDFYSKSIEQLAHKLNWKSIEEYHDRKGIYNFKDVSQEDIDLIKRSFSLDINLYSMFKNEFLK